jgi:hypothetical protein
MKAVSIMSEPQCLDCCDAGSASGHSRRFDGVWDRSARPPTAGGLLRCGIRPRRAGGPTSLARDVASTELSIGPLIGQLFPAASPLVG